METNNFDLLTGRTHTHLESFGDHLIQAEVMRQFLAMSKKAKEDDGIEIKLVSAFRSFEKQQIIWNDKVAGHRKILDDTGAELDPSSLTAKELLYAILRFSALPGASRHHWGTDLDVFDASIKSKKDVQLTVSESLEDFSHLNNWLDQNMNDFGFYRPYAQDLGGVSQEPWHISYYPHSKALFEQYSFEVFKENIQRSQISLKGLVLNQLDEIFQKFVINIEER